MASPLSTSEADFFCENGYFIRHDAVPSTLINRAVDGLWSGIHADRNDPTTWIDAEPKQPQSSDPQSLDDIVYTTGLFDTIEAMAGKNRLNPTAPPTPLLRYPSGSSDWPSPSGGHVDGYGQQDGTVSGFTVAVAVYLNDIQPQSGGFCVWPGTHTRIGDYLRSHSLLSVNKRYQETNGKESGGQVRMSTIIDMPPPLDITAPAGTAIFWHGRIVHSASKNRGRDIRMGLFTRYRWTDWPLLQFETPDDPWEHWKIGDPIREFPH